MAQNKLFNLEQKVKEAAQKYYTDGTSEMSDAEFDAAVEEVRKMNPNSEVLKVGWGYDVNKDSTPGAKCPHKYGTVGSLNKCHNWKEIGQELTQAPIFLSLKLDGISVVLYYERGSLVQALTRGENNIGIDITDKVLYVDDSLSHIKDDTFTGAVRGELLMSYDNFDKFKELHPDAENARNSTAGLKNANGITPDLKFLDIVVYTVIGDTGVMPYPYDPSSCLTMHQIITWLRQNFKHVAPYDCNQLTEDTYKEYLDQLRCEWYGVYPADGIVLTKKEVGYDKNSFEVKYIAKAFKFPAESKNTEVLDVEWSLSKSRYLIPRVKLDTVRLSGTSVSYCTGYNAKYIQDNNISAGAIVEVEKRGEIIPNINKVILSGQAQLPTHCPDCGHSLIWEGVNLKCPNSECSNANRQDLSVWLENIAHIDGLGDALKFKFLEVIYGEDLSIEKVMDSESEVDSYIMNSRTGHKKLIADMLRKLYGHDGTKVSLTDALIALNVPRLGSINAAKLSKHPEYVDTLMICSNPSSEFWTSLADIIGVANRDSIRDNGWKFKRLRYIKDRIIWNGMLTVLDDEPASTIKVAITGKLSVKRSEFEKELRNAGYEPADISKNTKFLITDNPNSSSSKNKKADQWGIEKITESEFRNRYL